MQYHNIHNIAYIWYICIYYPSTIHNIAYVQYWGYCGLTLFLRCWLSAADTIRHFQGKSTISPPKNVVYICYPNCWAQASLYLSDGQTNVKLPTVSPHCLFGHQNNVFFPFAALQGNMTLHNTRSHTSNVLQLYLYVLKEYTISPKNKEIQLCICNFWCHEYFKWVSVGMGG